MISIKRKILATYFWHVFDTVLCKSTKMRLIYTLLLLAWIHVGIYAQFTVGFDVQSFHPTSDLRETTSGLWGGGASIEGLYKIPSSPLEVGLHFGVSRYGSELRKGWHGNFLGDVRYRRQFEMMQTSILTRFHIIDKGYVRPYAEALIGLQGVYTRSVIRGRGRDDFYDHFLDIHDFALSYGVGMGVLIELDDGVFLDIGFRDMRSSRTTFLTPRSVRYDSDATEYVLDVNQARFNHWQGRIGVSILLN